MKIGKSKRLTERQMDGQRERCINGKMDRWTDRGRD
jgi:hypothetical protein